MAVDLAELPSPQQDETLLALDEALTRLAQAHPEEAELVKLRYFAGLTISEAAEVLQISTSTADRYWAYARAWLQVEMRAERGPA